MTEKIHLSCEIPEELAGQRLDQALARVFPDYSRSCLQRWIKAGQVQINGRAAKTREPVAAGDHVVIDGELAVQAHWQAQAIALDVIFEDESLIVINKPAGLVSHPGAGNPDNTLSNALLHHCHALEQLPRAGLIHRLDKSTTGLLVVAKTLPAHTALVRELQARNIHREYAAIVNGVMTAGGTVEAPIGRHPKQRIKMAVLSHGGKHAVTHYRVIQRFAAHTYIKVILETGRTHQIRVHMAHIHYPIVGDPVYGGRQRLPKDPSPELKAALQNFNRQALHARRLSLMHPELQTEITWEAPLPEDFQHLLDCLSDGTV